VKTVSNHAGQWLMTKAIVITAYLNTRVIGEHMGIGRDGTV